MDRSTPSVEVSFLLLSGSWGLNLGHQAWQHIPLPLNRTASLGPISKFQNDGFNSSKLFTSVLLRTVRRRVTEADFG